MGPRWFRIGHLGDQEGPEMTQDKAKMAQGGPPFASKRAHNEAIQSQDGALVGHGGEFWRGLCRGKELRRSV